MIGLFQHNIGVSRRFEMQHYRFEWMDSTKIAVGDSGESNTVRTKKVLRANWVVDVFGQCLH